MQCCIATEAACVSPSTCFGFRTAVRAIQIRKEKSVFRSFSPGTLVLVVLMVAGWTASSDAHTTFKKRLEEKYEGTKVSCNACHVEGEKKTVRNDFGKLFHKEFEAKELDLTEGFKSRKGAERKQYEKEVMVPAFDEALKKVKEKTIEEGGDTYDTLIKAGKLDGVTLREDD